MECYEATTTTLGAGDDEEVRETLRMDTEKGLGALCVPHLREGATQRAR